MARPPAWPQPYMPEPGRSGSPDLVSRMLTMFSPAQVRHSTQHQAASSWAAYLTQSL